MEDCSWCALTVYLWETEQHAKGTPGNWLPTLLSRLPQRYIDLAPQDLFMKSGFRMGFAKIWLTSHTKKETKMDGVKLTSFRKEQGSNLSRGTNYSHWGPCFPQSVQMFWDIIFSTIHIYFLFNIINPSVQFITISLKKKFYLFRISHKQFSLK